MTKSSDSDLDIFHHLNLKIGAKFVIFSYLFLSHNSPSLTLIAFKQ